MYLILNGMRCWIHVRSQIHPQITFVFVQFNFMDRWITRIVAFDVTVGQRVLNGCNGCHNNVRTPPTSTENLNSTKCIPGHCTAMSYRSLASS